MVEPTNKQSPKELILLGAGASAEAGMPMATQLPLVFHEYLNNSSGVGISESGDCYARVHSELVLDRENKRLSPPDIEDMMEALQALHFRATDATAPFVHKWKEYVHRLGGEDTGSAEREGWFTSPPQYFRHSNYSFLILMVQGLICDHLAPRTQLNSIYLEPLIRYAHEKGLCVTTLNYDFCFEFAAKKQGIPVDTGIGKDQGTGRLSFDPQAIKLLKVHGSAEWYFEHGHLKCDRSAIGTMSIQRGSSGFYPGIIFHGGNKLTPFGPFLQIYTEWENELREADQLTIIGYSLRDNHILETIYRWLENDDSKSLRIANGPGFSENDIPVRLFAGLYTPELRNRSEIFPLNASEAINEWYA